MGGRRIGEARTETRRTHENFKKGHADKKKPELVVLGFQMMMVGHFIVCELKPFSGTTTTADAFCRIERAALSSSETKTVCTTQTHKSSTIASALVLWPFPLF